MFTSILRKSKSLIGFGDKNDAMNSNRPSSIQPAVCEEEILDETTLKERMDELKETVYENIRTIKDPEKPSTLEDLNVVFEDCVQINSLDNKNLYIIRVEFNPTVPHCSLATLIGLCIRVKLQRNLTENFKLDIYIKKGTHNTEEEINKQINDKERIAAAMENPNLKDLVEECIQDQD